MDRRKFLQALGATTIFLACSKDDPIGDVPKEEDKVLFRFAIASDLHFGEQSTDYLTRTRNFVSAFKEFNQKSPCEFIVLNGDIIHNDPEFLPQVYAEVKDIHPRLYVTQGNHDRVSDSVWQNTWDQAVNSDFELANMAFIFGTTSDVAGALKCPDPLFLKNCLEKYKNKEHVFIFWHIHPHYADMACGGDVKDILRQYPNVRGIFNGHDHNDESIKIIDKIPYMFNGRVGGSWGSFDRNFRVVEVTKSSIVTYLMTPTNKKMLNTFNLATK